MGVEIAAKTAVTIVSTPELAVVRGCRKSGGKPQHSKLAATPIEWLDQRRSGLWL